MAFAWDAASLRATVEDRSAVMRAFKLANSGASSRASRSRSGSANRVVSRMSLATSSTSLCIHSKPPGGRWDAIVCIKAGCTTRRLTWRFLNHGSGNLRSKRTHRACESKRIKD